MSGECAPERRDLKDMTVEQLWELINDNRHKISLDVHPCRVIPYLRQARVLTEMDEDEILSCHKLSNRSMRTSYMLDLLRTQGRNGAVALLDCLMIHYPTLYTQVTGHKPSIEPSRFSGLIKYSELTEYLVRAVTGMQKELTEARSEASRMTARCTSLEGEIKEIMEQEEKTRYLQTENERMQRQIRTLQREITKMKDEKCDFYVRYTSAIEEKSALNMRLHDLTLQVNLLWTMQYNTTIICLLPAVNTKMNIPWVIFKRLFLKHLRYNLVACNFNLVITLTLCLMCFQAYQSRDEAQAMITRILMEKDGLRSQLVELQERLLSMKAVHVSRERRKSSGVCNVYVNINSTAEMRGCIRVPSQTSAPPFLLRSRPKAIRINGRVLTISFQGETLLQQLSVVGGNKTGVFVHQVTEDSPAHMVGINPGAQIVEVKYEQKEKALKMVLEDSTLEEAVWALGQVTGFCHLSLRPRPDDYQALVQQLQSNEISSGDSFYVRVNMSLSSGCGGTLAVSCNDILHVTNTWPTGAPDSWEASQVHPCQLLHLHSGTVPNYFRLVNSGRAVPQKPSVRIVSTGHQGRNPLWVSFENEGGPESGDTTAKGCVTLMPYTLVTPHFPPVCRPILLLPSIFGRVLEKKLIGWEGFQLLKPGKTNLEGIHCVLPLGLDCVRRLHRADIYPIIIFIGQSSRSAHKLKSKLHRHGHSEEQLLACSRSEEPLLDKLPCLYHSMAPDSWCDYSSLLTHLRTVIWEEQKKIVWVEPDLW
uniref:Uncharacterized protein n=1 Tax=Periophthalmus magnuspinnatus TaxID=409849 RepID=A0A3B4A5Z6_9GOBI